MMYVPCNSQEIRHAYISKHNSTRENQATLLNITDNEKWRYLTALLNGIMKDFYCLNCLNSFRTANKLKKCENVCKSLDYCYIKKKKKDKRILKYNQGEKSAKVLFIIYAGTESSLEKKDTSQSNPEKSATTKKNKQTVCGYS